MAIIREVFPDDLEAKAIDIAQKESKLNNNAYNGSCCYGLFQLHWEAHRKWMEPMGITVNDLFDPRVNAQLALTIYQRAGGWSPWTTA